MYWAKSYFDGKGSIWSKMYSFTKSDVLSGWINLKLKVDHKGLGVISIGFLFWYKKKIYKTENVKEIIGDAQ